MKKIRTILKKDIRFYKKYCDELNIEEIKEKFKAELTDFFDESIKQELKDRKINEKEKIDMKINEKEKIDMKYEQIHLFDSKESKNKIEDKSEYLHKSIGIFRHTGSLKSLQFIVDVDNEKEEFTVYNSTNPFSYREYKVPFSKLDILGIEDGDHYTSKLISHKKETIGKKLEDYDIWKKENFRRKLCVGRPVYYNDKEYTIGINKYNSITNKYDLFLNPVDENDWEKPVISYSQTSELMDKVTFEKEELTKVKKEKTTKNKPYSEIFNEIKKCEKLKDYVVEKCEKEYTEVTQYNIETMIDDKIKTDLENIFGKNEEFKNMADVLPVYLEHTESKNNYTDIKNLDKFVDNIIKSNINDITNDIFNKNKNYDKNQYIEKDM